MRSNVTPWEERYTWYWFREAEIFDYTQEDFDRSAKELHERGITVAINFTFTHFRFGFYRYWDKIHNAFKMFVNSCHKYGIKVIEHHSASLIHDLLRKDGWGRFEDDLGSFSNFTATVDNWIEVPRFMVNDPHVYGKRLSSMYQIDGRTGKIADSLYHLRCFCYNNPDYREMYFKYMTDLLAEVPFDGVMDDDVQYFGDGHACTCEHCRAKFKEKYGYTLPQPEDWGKFYGDYSNPEFIAWERFKRESTEGFYRDLTKLYESLGLKLLRPNYASDVLKWCPTAYAFDRCYDDWDCIFQENCFSAVMKVSYPDFMVEAIHRFACAEKNGVPSMSLFYPDRDDSAYFAWSLAKTWGQLYTGTCEGVDTTGIEKKYRDFEKQNILAYSSPKKREDIAFYFSSQTRDYSAPQYEMAEKYSFPFLGAMQAASFAKLGVSMAFEDESADELLKHKRLATVCAALVSDEELCRFKEYVNRGGKLIIYGDFATLDSFNKPRSADKVAAALGLNVGVKTCEKSADLNVAFDGKNITLSNMKALLAFDGAESIATLCGECVGIRAKLGEGEIIWIAAKTNESEFQKTVWAMRRQEVPPHVEAYPSLRAHQLSHSGALMDLLVGEREFEIECAEDELLVNAYDTEAGIAINIANIADTIPEDNRLVGHQDIIEHYAEGANKLSEISVKIKASGIRRAVLRTPECDRTFTFDVTEKDGIASFTVPEGTFAAYALIVLEK